MRRFGFAWIFLRKEEIDGETHATLADSMYPDMPASHERGRSVLASLRDSTYRMRFSEVRITSGAYPLAKVHSRASGHTKCSVYLLASSLAAALLGTGRVSARRVGRVRSLAFLSILLTIQTLSPNVLSRQHVTQSWVFPRTAWRGSYQGNHVHCEKVAACPTLCPFASTTFQMRAFSTRKRRPVEVTLTPR